FATLNELELIPGIGTDGEVGGPSPVVRRPEGPDTPCVVKAQLRIRDLDPQRTPFQHGGNFQPVRQTQFMAPGTDRFTEIDDIHRPFAHRFVKLQGLYAGPVVLQGAQGDFHEALLDPFSLIFISMAGDRRPASAAALPRPWPAQRTRSDARYSALHCPEPDRSPDATHA